MSKSANSTFMKPLKTTPDLEAIVGASEISRPQATKKVWDYIKKNGLQDQNDRRKINVGGTDLGRLFPGKKSVTMFELPAGINKNLKDG